VILVPVIFGFLGFAVDLGKLYLVRAELKAAADSMALAAAAQLDGTAEAATNASAAVEIARTEFEGFGNRFNFGGVVVGESEGNTSSTVDTPEFFDTVSAATGEGGTGGEPRHARVTVSAQVPSIFFRFLPQAVEGTVQLRVQSVAGMSAPLCSACGVEAIVVAALDTGDTEHFGFAQDTRYTLGFVCNGPNQPQPLAGTTQRIPYLIYNRLNEEAETFADEATQAFRIGAGGLPASTNEDLACTRVTTEEPEVIWTSAAPLACSPPGQQQRVPGLVSNYLCGMATRFETGVFSGCESVPEADAAAAPFVPDTNVEDLDEYAAYTGNKRRILTIAIAETIDDPQAIAIAGFRQFLLEPQGTNIAPSDGNGRFIALYIGSPVPLRQGRVSGCTIENGPGKVVLHQ
jgi:Flp pilus assembly protein TadG